MPEWIWRITNGLKEGARKWVKSIDIFGVPITINYQGKERFNTFIGGFVTIIKIIYWL